MEVLKLEISLEWSEVIVDQILHCLCSKETGDSQSKTLNHLPRVADGEFMELQHVHDAALVKTTVKKEYIQTCTDATLGLSHLCES